MLKKENFLIYVTSVRELEVSETVTKWEKWEYSSPQISNRIDCLEIKIQLFGLNILQSYPKKEKTQECLNTKEDSIGERRIFYWFIV